MGIDELNDDCLCQILECVDNESPATTKKSLRFVNKRFHATARVIGHRRKTLYFPEPGYKYLDRFEESEFASWLNNDDILRGLHFLTIKSLNGWERVKSLQGSAKDDETEDKKFEALVTLITRLGSLKNLVWSYHGPVPLKVLEALHKHHPKAELQVYNLERLDDTTDHHNAAEVALSKSPALTVVRARIWFYGQATHPDLREAAFRRVVANAPNLRHASVVTGHSGCVISILSDEDRQELEDLSLRFLTHKKPNTALRNLTLDGYRLSGETLKDWGKLVDLSKLESIKCSRGMPDESYFTYAPQVLKNLKHVSLNLGSESMRDVVQDYLMDVAPLESISLWSWMGKVSLSSLLSRHGRSLRTLQLHERESVHNYPASSRKLLDSKALTALKDSCPNLQDLTIDLNRRTSLQVPEDELKQESEKLQLLASMNLDKLQIYYDIGLLNLANNPHSNEALYEDGDDDNDADHDTDNDTPQNISSPLSPKSPPRKRVKKSEPKNHLPPSKTEDIETFVKALWKTIFGQRSTTSPRALDVKFGEWERKPGTGYPAPWVTQEQMLKTWWVVRPDERDDRVGECVVERHGGGARV